MQGMIRKATISDAGAISELYRVVWNEQRGAFPEELLSARQPAEEEVLLWLEQKDFFLYLRDGRALGVVGLEQRHGTGHLVHMVVLGEQRGLGIGRELVARVEEECRRRGLVKVWLDTSKRLHASMAFYEALGYRRIGILERHYWGETIVLYEKLLPAPGDA